MAIALFLFINPYQLLSQSGQDTIEFEECALTADEVENFSEYKTADTGTVAEQSHESEAVELNGGFVLVVANFRKPLRGSGSAFHKIPKIVLFQVFRI